MDEILELMATLKKGAGFSKIFLIANDKETALRILESEPDIPAVVATSNVAVQEAVTEAGHRARKIKEKPMGGLSLLGQAEEMLRMATAEGLFESEDKVLVVFTGALTGAVLLDVRSVGITRLMETMGEEVNMEVVETLLTLSLEIAQEGREGKAVGALFIIGDTEEVMKTSRQIIINPFKGHTEEARDVRNRENWETVKEMAQLDGAFVIDDTGQVIAAGRYVGVNWDIYLQGGLGGRHLAAASISKMTTAIAMVVSTQGTVRIFKGGREIFRVNAV
jgi:diadenylate cyclase